MQKVLLFWFYISSYVVFSKQHKKQKEVDDPLEVSYSDKVYYKYIIPNGPYSNDVKEAEDKRINRQGDTLSSYRPPLKQDFQALLTSNPVLSTLLLSDQLHLQPKYASPNHSGLLPINPFVALLLSQYGRYLPLYGAGKGIYAYQASNDYHNNKPFGSYKIYEDSE